MMVFHWHGDAFDLQEGAVRTVSSAACVNQAFQYDRHVVGIQFHLESTPESLGRLIAHCGQELMPAPFIQSADQMTRMQAEDCKMINSWMSEILTRLTGFEANVGD